MVAESDAEEAKQLLSSDFSESLENQVAFDEGGPFVGLEPWLWSDEWYPMVLGGVARWDFPLWAGALAVCAFWRV